LSRCRGCNKEIEVRYIQPEGCKHPILEDLCTVCLYWVEVAKGNSLLLPPNARRKPKEPAIYEEDG
jgi:hypothetical protein